MDTIHVSFNDENSADETFLFKWKKELLFFELSLNYKYLAYLGRAGGVIQSIFQTIP